MSSSPSATTVAAAAAAAAAAGTGTDAGATEPVTTDQPASPAPGSATPPSENVDPLVAPYGVDRLGRPRRRPPIITYEQMASYTPADREAAHARSSLLTTLMKRHGRCAACLWPTQCSTDEPGSYRPPGSDPSVQWTDPLTKIPLYQPFPRPGLPEQTTGPVLRAPANGACNCASIGPAISQLGVGPQGDGKHRIALYMHSKEWSRSSNTGKIIANLCPGALVACHAVSPSERRIYRATMAALRAGRQPFILFPTPDSQPLEDFLAAHPVTAQPLPLSDPTELAFVSAGFDDGGEADEAGGVPGEPAINRILRGLGEYQSFEHCADAAILDRWSWPEADVPVPVTGPVRGYFIIVIDGTWGQVRAPPVHPSIHPFLLLPFLAGSPGRLSTD
ncbi:hypothetical protein, variant [Fonticula alba]|uniref:tRNA-uridine aminocarboxypropyltransferase n=1 Tax=Fonticula alba TaxID=691883 RepID=A0A058Z997_FONAL|nr:hypothetical protein, variant [Fonticula alba]KCV70681.1 hypothetical protein, variant [Fonticula alba]|eukprot:XP_009495197.1 hypothetical protein, variant [Fonticula alba]